MDLYDFACAQEADITYQLRPTDAALVCENCYVVYALQHYTITRTHYRERDLECPVCHVRTALIISDNDALDYVRRTHGSRVMLVPFQPTAAASTAANQIQLRMAPNGLLPPWVQGMLPMHAVHLPHLRNAETGPFTEMFAFVATSSSMHDPDDNGLPPSCKDMTLDEVMALLEPIPESFPAAATELSSSLAGDGHPGEDDSKITASATVEGTASGLSASTSRDKDENDQDGSELCDALHDPNCSICLEQLACMPSVRLYCRHRFHAVCLRSWFAQGQYTCPTCRRPALQD